MHKKKYNNYKYSSFPLSLCTEFSILFPVAFTFIVSSLKRIFDDGELIESSVIKKYLITAADGKNYNTNHYNLQAIIAVGFKVNNDRAVQFRKWAGQIVKDYTIQGWTMDVERLKKGTLFTDLYATAFDYDKDSKTTRLFFQTVQNKMHYATLRHTAAELIVERADASKEHMGLTSWENAPDGKIVKSDVSIAKNYLTEKELSFLKRIVSLYLDYAELQAERHIPMSMEDWAKRLDGFLEFNGTEILTGPGKISAEQAMNMTFLSTASDYIPSYTRTELTDALHQSFGFRTDYEIITKASMRTVIKNTKILKRPEI